MFKLFPQLAFKWTPILMLFFQPHAPCLAGLANLHLSRLFA
jgi:hypothetical protein